jgi:hypothetical protein
MMLNAELIVPMPALRPAIRRFALFQPYTPTGPARNSRSRFITLRLARVASSTRAKNRHISQLASLASEPAPRAAAFACARSRFSAWQESANSSSRSASRRASAREASPPVPSASDARARSPLQLSSFAILHRPLSGRHATAAYRLQNSISFAAQHRIHNLRRHRRCRHIVVPAASAA